MIQKSLGLANVPEGTITTKILIFADMTASGNKKKR